jgi:hypothetical protein
MKSLLKVCLCLGLLSVGSAYAQTTHLNVSPKQIVTLQVNPDTAVTPAGQFWSEWLFGVKSGGTAALFVVPKGKTLVVTDLDMTVNCTAASTTKPLFSITIYDATGAPLHHLSRFTPTLTTVGREQIKASFTSGVVVPEGYQVGVENMQIGNHLITRGALLGYYVQ